MYDMEEIQSVRMRNCAVIVDRPPASKIDYMNKKTLLIDT